MNQTTINQLLQLNRDFYAGTWCSFSDTRQSQWQGWNNVLPYVKELQKPITVLDIGCGNGRFAQFLQGNHLEVDYLGVDGNDDLLSVARDQFANTNYSFHILDLPRGLKHISDTFDLIVMFGVWHHLPGLYNRLDLLKHLQKLLNPNGYLMISCWQFMNEPRLAKKVIPWNTAQIDESELESGDYLLSWQESPRPRYCHYTSDEELETVIKNTTLNLIEHFTADTGNAYLIWEKNR